MNSHNTQCCCEVVLIHTRRHNDYVVKDTINLKGQFSILYHVVVLSAARLVALKLCFDLISPSPSFYSHGRLPCPARVGTCWGVRRGEIPVPDPRPARACHQLGERQTPSGHQGWEVGPNHIMAWRLLETAALYRSFNRSLCICYLLSYICFSLSLSLIGTLFCRQGFCRLQACVKKTVEGSAVWHITVQEWNTARRHFLPFQVLLSI